MPSPTSKRSAAPAQRVLALGLAGLVIAGAATHASAQVTVAPVAATSMALAGAVQDSRGLPLLGAFVAAIALGSDQPAAIVVTDARGEFRFNSLSRGMYTLLVGSLGFAGTVVQGINVPAAAPLTLQLDPQAERSLSAFEAPLNLGWALRSSSRDVLRQGETMITEDATAEPGVAAPVAALERSANRWGTMGGEVRLWSFTNTGDSETVGVTALSLGDDRSWNLKAFVGDRGAVWAAGNVNQPVNGDHSLTFGFGYVGGDFDFWRPAEAVQDSWIGRLEARDNWQVSDALQVDVATRYERHNYMADPSLVSPSLRLAYSPPVQGMRLTAGVARNQQGLDLTQEESAFDVISLLGNSNLRLSDTSGVQPQTTVRFEIGVEQELGPAQVRVKAYFDDVTDELLGVYVAGPGGSNNYLLFNVGDTAASGVEVGLATALLDGVSGEVVYTYRERDEPYAMPAYAGLLPVGQDWQVQQTHDIAASVAAEIVPLRTHVRATYNWTHGMPVVRDGRLGRDYGRFDLRVRQPLPFQMLDTEWSAMVQVRNLMGPEYQGVYNVTLAELLGLSRGIAGGLAVRF